VAGWGCTGDLSRPEAFGPKGRIRLRFVLAMPESLPAVPIVACRSAKCQTEQDSSSHFVASYVIPAEVGIHRMWVPACAGTTRFLNCGSVGGTLARDRLERRSREKHKNSTNEASMLLKTQDGIGKLTQNVPKNEPGFECQMRELDSNSEHSRAACVQAGELRPDMRKGTERVRGREPGATRENYKKYTIEASMLLKTQDGIEKRTQNEPKNGLGFECQVPHFAPPRRTSFPRKRESIGPAMGPRFRGDDEICYVVSMGGLRTFGPSAPEISEKHKIAGTKPRSC